jgi:hypothetical protein
MSGGLGVEAMILDSLYRDGINVKNWAKRRFIADFRKG